MGGTSAFSSQRSRFINTIAKKAASKLSAKGSGSGSPKKKTRGGGHVSAGRKGKRPGSRRRQRGLFGTTDTLGVEDTPEITENDDIQVIGSRRG